MLAHRILVMRDGMIVAELESAAASEDEILLAATSGGSGR